MLNMKEQLVYSSIRSRQCYYNNNFSKYRINKIDNLNIHKYSTKLKFNRLLKDINAINYERPIMLKNDMGFLFNDQTNLYVNFQGSKNYLELLDSVNSKSMQPFKFLKGNVHSGFGKLFLDLKDELSQEIKNILDSYNIKRITFSGHSKGGSLSSIASLYYGYKCNHEEKKYYIINHAYGMPLTGDINFINSLMDFCDISLSIQNMDDIVQYIPLNKDFRHIPITIKLFDKDMFRVDNETKVLSIPDLLLFGVKQRDDLIKNHSCDSYIENLVNRLL